MYSQPFSLKNINREGKFQSFIFMTASAVLANMPAIKDWLLMNTSLDPEFITGAAMVIGYLLKTWIMPTSTPINK